MCICEKRLISNSFLWSSTSSSTILPIIIRAALQTKTSNFPNLSMICLKAVSFCLKSEISYAKTSTSSDLRLSFDFFRQFCLTSCSFDSVVLVRMSLQFSSANLYASSSPIPRFSEYCISHLKSLYIKLIVLNYIYYNNILYNNYL